MRKRFTSRVETLSGWIVPARRTQSDDERQALRAANGYDAAQERATKAVVLGALLLMLLMVMRMACG